MKKISLFILSILILTCLTGCDFFDFFNKDDDSITITYVLKDNNIAKTYDSYDSIEFISYSTETGYEFLGWSLSTDGAVVSKADLKGKSSVKLYPIVSLKNYKIIYELDGGTNSSDNPLTYTIEDEITIKAPTKDGYAFSGWMVNDNETLVSEYKIEKGSNGDLTLKANYLVGKVNVFFDYPGVDIQTIDYNTKCTKPTDPTKLGDTFICWCSDDALEHEFDFDTLITTSITLYPKWENTAYYKLTINNYEYVNSNYENNKELPSGAKVILSIDYILENKEFIGWYEGDTLLSRVNEYTFKMPSSNYEISARLKDLTTYTYTKGIDSKVSILVDSPNKNLYGNDIDGNYTFNGNYLEISKNYLDKLDLGLHSFIYNEDTIIYLFIKASNKKTTNINVDYDINYPNATLTFDYDENYSYSYSLDGTEYVSCTNKTVFSISNKTISHTLDVKCDESITTYTIEAMPLAAAQYLSQTFTYQGNTYDFYIDSFSDLEALLEYESLAAYPKAKGESYTFKFYFPNGSNQDYAKESYSKIINRLSSAPYGLYYSYTFSTIVEFTLKSNNTFNSKRTTQERTDITTTKFKESYRSSDYNDFYIEKCSKTQEIRSIYELENLELGIKPIITDQTVLYLYNKAKDILRTYVDDSFTIYEKLKAIYDYLGAYVTYDDVLISISHNRSDYESFTSYGALMDGVAVCDGIASAFKLLCTIEGIECVEVIGSAKEGGHAWNKVKISDVWYGIDATWSRGGFGSDIHITHTYFLVDELTLMNYGDTHHYEQATYNYETYEYDDFNIVNTANNTLGYFELFTYDGYDFICESKEEYVLMYNAFRFVTSLDFIELKLSGIVYDDIKSLCHGTFDLYYSTSDSTLVYLIRK